MHTHCDVFTTPGWIARIRMGWMGGDYEYCEIQQGL